MERLSAWLVAEGYADTMVPQVLGVARGLSAWLDDRDVVLQVLTDGALEAFAAEYGPGVAGHTIVAMRLPAVRRFLVETGLLAGDPAWSQTDPTARSWDFGPGQRRCSWRAGGVGPLAA